MQASPHCSECEVVRHYSKSFISSITLWLMCLNFQKTARLSVWCILNTSWTLHNVLALALYLIVLRAVFLMSKVHLCWLVHLCNFANGISDITIGSLTVVLAVHYLAEIDKNIDPAAEHCWLSQWPTDKLLAVTLSSGCMSNFSEQPFYSHAGFKMSTFITCIVCL